MSATFTPTYTIDDMQWYAKQNGGRCLSKEYRNNKTVLTWQCKKGHVWDTVPRTITQGGWCPTCTHQRVKHSLEDAQQIAKEKEGKCLSKEYTNNTTKLKWKCSKGHQFDATLKWILKNHWCPFCSGWKSYTFDDIKTEAKKRGGLCLDNSYHKALDNLFWKCHKGHIWKATAKSVMINKTWCPTCAHHPYTLEDMQILAKKKHGLCLSKKFTTTKIKMKWQCPEGHTWKAPARRIMNGGWCPQCAIDKRRTPIEEIKKAAKQKGGICLSNSFINTEGKLKWRCKDGHEWEAKPDGIINRGQWCPYCAGRAPHTLKEMRQIAQKNGGLCLSAEYINTTTKLKWQCKNGHIWEAVPKTILKNHWCPACNGKPRHTISDMQTLAKQRNGKCLSKTYINNKTKLLWECSEAHRWETTPHNIVSGHWCPDCANQRLKNKHHQKQSDEV